MNFYLYKISKLIYKKKLLLLLFKIFKIIHSNNPPLITNELYDYQFLSKKYLLHLPIYNVPPLHSMPKLLH